MDVRGSGPLNAARMSALAKIADTHRLARLTRHGELIAQRATPTVTMGKARIALPPGSFLQATAAGEADACASSSTATSTRPKPWPICSAGSDPSRCGLPSAPASRPSMPMRARSQR